MWTPKESSVNGAGSKRSLSRARMEGGTSSSSEGASLETVGTMERVMGQNASETASLNTDFKREYKS